MDTQTFWSLDPKTKSQVLAAGVRGPITGEGFTLGYIDDPYKSRETAESMIVRESTQDWYTDTFLTRQDEKYSGILLTTTRWHKNDLAGYLLQKDGIKEYNNKKPFEGCPDWNGEDDGQWVVLNLVANGMTTSEILEAYPYLEDDDIRQALQYAAWLAAEKIRLVPLEGVAVG